MRNLWWGCIENLLIRNGVPKFTKATKTFVRTRRGRADSTQRRIFETSDPKPHEMHLQFFAWCRNVGNGVIRRIEIADGIPVSWNLGRRFRKRS